MTVIPSATPSRIIFLGLFSQSDDKIDLDEGSLREAEQIPAPTVKSAQKAAFEPKQPKRRRPGTGCISELSDHLFEGRYSPTNAYGKRISKNVYANTREECAEKLAALIAQMKAEIAEEKKR